MAQINPQAITLAISAIRTVILRNESSLRRVNRKIELAYKANCEYPTTLIELRSHHRLKILEFQVARAEFKESLK